MSESDDILLKIDSWTKLRELVPGIYTNLAECEKLDDNIKDHLTRSGFVIVYINFIWYYYSNRLNDDRPERLLQLLSRSPSSVQ